MTPIEAHQFAMTKVNELIAEGIEVTIKPVGVRNDEGPVKKPDEPDGIPPELWNKISFKGLDAIKAQKVMEMGNYLGMCGITFDSGGMSGRRDWEFDWSFNYKKGEEDLEWREARETVEDLINRSK